MANGPAVNPLMTTGTDDPVPLDDTTKPLAVLYGKLVNTAYSMYDLNKNGPNALTPPLPAPNQSDPLPTGWELTAWVQMSDFAFNGAEEPKFYGIIVRDATNPFSHVLAIRGTEGAVEWFDDAMCVPRAFTPVPKAGVVASGFDDIYMTMKVVRVPPPGGTPAPVDGSKLSDRRATISFADQVEELLKAVTPAPAPTAAVPMSAPAGPSDKKHDFAVTGHSLGGALCTLYTMEHAIKKKADGTRKVKLNTSCTFASPKVGMKDFVAAYDALTIDKWRIANDQDIVPKVPPSIPLLLEYQHVDTLYAFSSAGWVAFNPICWHSMYTYLHWLDATQPLASGC